jgi:hypothetical protein
MPKRIKANTNRPNVKAPNYHKIEGQRLAGNYNTRRYFGPDAYEQMSKFENERRKRSRLESEIKPEQRYVIKSAMPMQFEERLNKYGAMLRSNPVQSATLTSSQIGQFERNRALMLDSKYKGVANMYQDPLDYEMKIRLGNMFNFDPIAQQGILVRMHYALGHGWHTKLSPKTDVRGFTEDEANQMMLDAGVTEEEKQFSRDVIFTLESEEVCDIKNTFDMIFVQSLVSGRSLTVKEYLKAENPFYSSVVDPDNEGKQRRFPAGLPGALINLNFCKLGQVFIDPDTFQPKIIRYEDKLRRYDSEETRARAKGFTDIKIEDTIYATYGDFNIAPNDVTVDIKWYGMSTFLPILAISENSRRIHEIIMPQLNEIAWSGSGLFKVTDSQAVEDFKNFNNMIQAGRFMTYMGDSMEYQELKLTTNMPDMLSEVEKNNLITLTQVRTPSPVLNHENFTNRAVMEMVGLVWEVTTLEHDRDWIRRILKRFWYSPIQQKVFDAKSIFELKTVVAVEFSKTQFVDLESKARAIRLLNGITDVQTGMPLLDTVEMREMLGLPPLRVSVLASNQNLEETMAKVAEVNDKTLEQTNNNVDGELTPEQVNNADAIISR